MHISCCAFFSPRAEEYLEEAGVERIELYAVIFAQDMTCTESYKQTPTLSQIIFSPLFSQYITFIYTHRRRTSGKRMSSPGAFSALGRKCTLGPARLWASHQRLLRLSTALPCPPGKVGWEPSSALPFTVNSFTGLMCFFPALCELIIRD